MFDNAETMPVQKIDLLEEYLKKIHEGWLSLIEPRLPTGLPADVAWWLADAIMEEIPIDVEPPDHNDIQICDMEVKRILNRALQTSGIGGRVK